MSDYKAMYYALAAQVATATDILINAQLKGEEKAITEENTTERDTSLEGTEK